jgi:hypothetical protein
MFCHQSCSILADDFPRSHAVDCAVEVLFPNVRSEKQ